MGTPGIMPIQLSTVVGKGNTRSGLTLAGGGRGTRTMGKRGGGGCLKVERKVWEWVKKILLK